MTEPKEPQYKPTKKRIKDPESTIDGALGKFIDALKDLRKEYAKKMYYLLAGEIIGMFLILFLVGSRAIYLEKWFVIIFTESIIVQTFFTIQLIVKNLFPQESFEKTVIELWAKNQD